MFVDNKITVKYVNLPGQYAKIDGSNNWRVTSATISSNSKSAHTSSNDDTETNLSKNLTTLEVNVVYQENNSLVHQFFSVPIVGMFYWPTSNYFFLLYNLLVELGDNFLVVNFNL